MTKYKKQIEEMLEVHHDAFSAFKKVHDAYALDPEKWQEELNKEGKPILLLIQKWENNLCSKSESGRYGKFSSKLSDKFWAEIRMLFSKIDYIGMEKA